jgi:hypothetical protein
MPKIGDNTEGFDVKGGLEQTYGLKASNYKPSWANENKRVIIEGVDERDFKFYKLN